MPTATESPIEVIVNAIEELRIIGEKQNAIVPKQKKKVSRNKIVAKKNDYLPLIRLFESVTKNLVQEYDLSEEDIGDAIQDMNETFRKVPSGKYPTEINYDDMNYCVGYLHRFALCHAAMVQYAFSKIPDVPEIAGKFTSKRNLNIVCLGSGPGDEVFSFLSVFHSQCMGLTGIDITVVDKAMGWEDVFDNTIDILKEESHGDLSLLFQEGPRIVTSYIQGDLEKPRLSSELRAKLVRADVVLLTKVLSHIPEENKLRVLKSIENCMRFGTLLILIDAPSQAKKGEVMNSLKLVYKSCANFFVFPYKRTYFQHRNIRCCHASTRIYTK